jgi:hypothetical protein
LRRVLSTLWDETTAERLNGKFGQDMPWLLWDSDAETCLTAELTIIRRDEPLSRRRWQFSVREERRARGQEGGKP